MADGTLRAPWSPLSVSEILPRGSFRGDGLLTWLRAPEAGTESVCVPVGTFFLFTAYSWKSCRSISASPYWCR